MNRSFSHVRAVFVLFVFISSTQIAIAQTTWHVPADFPTIQQAINAASSKAGDEIIVAPGTYNEAINFNGKAVHLRSSDGPEVTIIDASGLGQVSVVTCWSGEGPDTILEGFTITGGNASEGGGMYNVGASPTVLNCIFEFNSAHAGGGMYNVANSSPAVNGCLFRGNSIVVQSDIWHAGGGILNSDSHPTITNCHFEANSAYAGGGIANFTSSPTVTNCSFAGNSATVAGAVWNYATSEPTISGSYFCKNTHCDVVGPWNDDGGNEFCNSGETEIILVPQAYDTIQEAINAAECHAEIIVGPGTYQEAINLHGKPIHLRSSDGPDVTIIDATDLYISVVTSSSGEGPETILEGFTLTGGTGTDVFSTFGGGMYIDGSSPSIINCRFVENSANIGGGMYIGAGSPSITDCVFEGNENSGSGWAGGGLHSAAGATATIAGTIFCQNKPENISGEWIDAGGNEFFGVCPWSKSVTVHVPVDYATIQSAIDEVPAWGSEIVVAPGVYNEAINFSGKHLHLRSSDGPEVTIIDASGLDMTVVRCSSGEGPLAILEGFTITGGNSSAGGGMFNSGASPTVTNCIFVNNSSSSGGGGIRNINSSNPTVTNCVFVGNSGGGMSNSSWSSPTVVDCIFDGNTATFGGGILNSGGIPLIINCTFIANSATRGGAIYNNSGSPTVINSTFSGNYASTDGGGIYNNGGSPTVNDSVFTFNSSNDGGGAIFNNSANATITNCLFLDNSANDGGGILNANSSPAVTQCTFEMNTANRGGTGGGIFNFNNSSPTISQCLFNTNIAGNGSAIGNLDDSNPTVSNSSFMANFAEYSGAGIWSDFDSVPEIGDSTFCENNPDHISGPFVELGGNEFLDECPDDCPEDLNSDNVVDGADLLILLSAWGKCANPDDCPADLNGDTVVDGTDLLILLSQWGPCP